MKILLDMQSKIDNHQKKNLSTIYMSLKQVPQKEKKKKTSHVGKKEVVLITNYQIAYILQLGQLRIRSDWLMFKRRNFNLEM